MTAESYFFILNGAGVSVSPDGILIEWGGRRVGVPRDVWEELKGGMHDNILGIMTEVEKRGLAGDVEVARGSNE